MKKKILILSWTPLYKWDYKRYDLKSLEKNYEIKIFDISKIFFRKFNVEKIYKKEDKIKCVQFKKSKKVITELKKIKLDLIINLTAINYNDPIYVEMLKKNVKIIKFIDYQLGNYLYFPKNIILYFKYFFKRFLTYFYSNNKNNIVIVGGNNLLNKINSLGKKIIYSHSINYDFLLRGRQKVFRKSNKKNIAYLDSGYGFHPDFKLSRGINKNFNVITFANKLNFFFKKLNDLGYRVFFLANPKVPKEKQNIYKNCKIIYYKTPEYIKKSDLVIFTSSSTIEYAIIFKKKILRLFSKEFNSYPINIQEYIGFKKFFCTSGFDLDTKFSKKEMKDKTLSPCVKYNEYFSKFIRHPKSKNLKFTTIIEKLLPR